MSRNGSRLIRTINKTELTATLINQKDNLLEGIQYAQEVIDGSMTILLLTAAGIYCARDKMGRTPLVIGKKEDGFCEFPRRGRGPAHERGKK